MAEIKGAYIGCHVLITDSAFNRCHLIGGKGSEIIVYSSLLMLSLKPFYMAKTDYLYKGPVLRNVFSWYGVIIMPHTNIIATNQK